MAQGSGIRWRVGGLSGSVVGPATAIIQGSFLLKSVC
jgi:hypothetical protein